MVNEIEATKPDGEPTTIEQMDLDQLRDRLTTIRVEISETSDDAAGDTAQERLIAERKKVNGRIQSISDEAESTDRDAAVVTMNDALGKVFDFRAQSALMQGVTVSGTYRKTDTGWDNLSIGVGFEGDLDLLKVFDDGFPLDSIKDLASVRGVSFTINRDGAKVEYVGKAPKTAKASTGTTGGGGRGHKWERNGVVVTLDEAFREVATAAESAEHDGIDSLPDVKSPGSKKWTLKTKVVKAAGYNPAT